MQKIVFAILLLPLFTQHRLIDKNNEGTCSCNVTPSINESYSNSSIIFKGKVVESEIFSVTDTSYIFPIKSGSRIDSVKESFTYKMAKVTFKIDEVFKGASVQKYLLDIYTNYGCCNCGYVFQTNETYLVYATLSKRVLAEKNSEKYLQTSICTRTNLFSKVLNNEVQELHELKKQSIVNN